MTARTSKIYETIRTLKAAIARKHKGDIVEVLCHVPDREYSIDVRDAQTRDIVVSYRVRKTMYGCEILLSPAHGLGNASKPSWWL
jgi:hypothetical protein